MEPLKLLNIDQTRERLGISRAQLQRMYENGLFPKPTYPTGRFRFWSNREVEQWILVAQQGNGEQSLKDISSYLEQQRQNITTSFAS